MTDDPRAWDLPYEEIPGDPIPLLDAIDQEPIFVDALMRSKEHAREPLRQARG